MLGAYAQVLQIMCAHSQVILHDVWKSKLSAPLVTADALPEAYLEQQVYRLVNLIRAEGPWQLTLVLLAVHMSTSGNQGVSTLGTNAYAYSAIDRKVRLATQEYQIDNSACYCLPSNDCQMPATMYSKSDIVPSSSGAFPLRQNSSTPIKGMKTACFPVDGILASTLECFYDTSCIQLLVPDSTAAPLNRAHPTRFPIADATLQDIFDEMMVEDWHYNFSWANYYTRCAPEQCSYSYSDRNGVLIIITTIIALLGGLNIAWRLIIPLLVRAVSRWLKKQSVPTDNTTTITGMRQCVNE